MDITRDAFAVLSRYEPDIVIHAAAMTDVRECESRWMDAENVNIKGTYNIATFCQATGAKMVYISTACVFDGECGPYSEMSKPQPKNFYSLTKYVGEKIVQMHDEYHLNMIIRTNFVPYERWKYPHAFVDRIGTYLFAHDVAMAMKSVIFENYSLVHICGDKEMSMYELAKITTPDIKPISIMEYFGPPLTRDMRLVTRVIKPFKITTKRGES